MLNNFKIDLKDILVVLRPNALQIHPASSNGTFQPRHLSLFFEARKKNGRLYFTPHLTAGRRKFFFWIPADAARRFGTEMMQELFRRWVSSSTPVDLAQMDDDGWEVMFLDEPFVQRWLEGWRQSDGKYRFPVDDKYWDDFGRKATEKLIWPAELATMVPPRAPLTALREVNGETQACLLSFYPDGLAGGPPGWYRTNIDWLPPKETTKIALQIGGAQLIQGLVKVAEFLGLRGDEVRNRLTSSLES